MKNIILAAFAALFFMSHAHAVIVQFPKREDVNTRVQRAIGPVFATRSDLGSILGGESVEATEVFQHVFAAVMMHAPVTSSEVALGIVIPEILNELLAHSPEALRELRERGLLNEINDLTLLQQITNQLAGARISSENKKDDKGKGKKEEVPSEPRNRRVRFAEVPPRPSASASSNASASSSGGIYDPNSDFAKNLAGMFGSDS